MLGKPCQGLFISLCSLILPFGHEQPPVGPQRICSVWLLYRKNLLQITNAYQCTTRPGSSGSYKAEWSWR